MFIKYIKCTLVIYLLLIAYTLGKQKKAKKTQSVRGTQCYNCMSYDHPKCWDPDHPDYENVTIDCYIPRMAFICIVITSESTKLIETGQEIGPVRVRTCVPAKEFKTKVISYEYCNKLSKELSASEMFSRITVRRPVCQLCTKHLCTRAQGCMY